MRHRRGFTLIELIVVVIVLGILLALVVPRLLGSTNDSNAQLIVKAVKDIRDAVAMAKLKCLGAINAAAGSIGVDTQALLSTLWGQQCQVLSENAYTVDAQNYARVKDFGIQTDYQNANNLLVVNIDCQGNNDICNKVRDQLNTMYGGSSCPTPPNNGYLTCNLQL
uniref:Prepilin-type N-terminal cleavage/methylation domain-containing protein n=1 Tax=Thermocrinis ruber TaxID=75906 RepID=A0A7C5X1P7_9AQUI